MRCELAAEQSKLVLVCHVALTGSKGNKTEVAGPLMFSIFLAAPMVAFHAYYLQFETYV